MEGGGAMEGGDVYDFMRFIGGWMRQVLIMHSKAGKDAPDPLYHCDYQRD